MTQMPTYAGKTFTCDDSRADGLIRNVRVEASHVAIARRFKGIAMRLDVPVATFRGVALSAQAGLSGAPFYELTLLHQDADLSLVLAQAASQQQLAAGWDGWSGFFAIPKLVERQAGVYERCDDTPEVARFAARRRCSLTRQRRGKFATRRKPGLPARMQQRFDEAEIIARN